MASIVQSLVDVVKSLFEVVFSVFRTAFNTVEGGIGFVLHFFTGIVNMVLETLKGSVKLTGNIGQFLISNIFVIGVIALGAFGFLQYQRSQGRTVKVGDKKLN